MELDQPEEDSTLSWNALGIYFLLATITTVLCVISKLALDMMGVHWTQCYTEALLNNLGSVQKICAHCYCVLVSANFFARSTPVGKTWKNVEIKSTEQVQVGQTSCQIHGSVKIEH